MGEKPVRQETAGPAKLFSKPTKAGILRKILPKGLPVVFEGKKIVLPKRVENGWLLRAIKVPGINGPAIVTRHQLAPGVGSLRAQELFSKKHVAGMDYAITPNETNVEYLHVDKHFRGRGMGSQMYSVFEGMAKGSGAEKATLFAHVPATGFFEKQGFARGRITTLLSRLPGLKRLSELYARRFPDRYRFMAKKLK